MGCAADEWRQIALSSIMTNGRKDGETPAPVTFTTINYGAHNANMLDRGEGTVSTYECYAAPVNKVVRSNDNSVVLTSVKLLYIPATDTSGNDIFPKVGDTVQLEDVYQVLEILDNYETESVACAYLLRIGK